MPCAKSSTNYHYISLYLPHPQWNAQGAGTSQYVRWDFHTIFNVFLFYYVWIVCRWTLLFIKIAVERSYIFVVVVVVVEVAACIDTQTLVLHNPCIMDVRMHLWWNNWVTNWENVFYSRLIFIPFAYVLPCYQIMRASCWTVMRRSHRSDAKEEQSKGSLKLLVSISHCLIP